MILSILLDQNIPPCVCDFVRKAKPHWIVRHINDLGLEGAADEIIFRRAEAEKAIVITFDEDFADARMLPRWQPRRCDSSARVANYN